jgi:hypothetical protein
MVYYDMVVKKIGGGEMKTILFVCVVLILGFTASVSAQSAKKTLGNEDFGKVEPEGNKEEKKKLFEYMELKRTFPTWNQIGTIEDVEGGRLQINRHKGSSGSVVGIQFGGGTSEKIWISDQKGLKQLDTLLSKMSSSDSTLTAGSVTDLYEAQIRVEKLLNNLWTIQVEMPPANGEKRSEIKMTLDEPNAKKLCQKISLALKG